MRHCRRAPTNVRTALQTTRYALISRGAARSAADVAALAVSNFARQQARTGAVVGSASPATPVVADAVVADALRALAGTLQ